MSIMPRSMRTWQAAAEWTIISKCTQSITMAINCTGRTWARPQLGISWFQIKECRLAFTCTTIRMCFAAAKKMDALYSEYPHFREHHFKNTSKLDERRVEPMKIYHTIIISHINKFKFFCCWPLTSILVTVNHFAFSIDLKSLNFFLLKD